jgi:hypothetical protein
MEMVERFDQEEPTVKGGAQPRAEKGWVVEHRGLQSGGNKPEPKVGPPGTSGIAPEATTSSGDSSGSSESE